MSTAQTVGAVACNGVDATTGTYLLPRLTAQQVARVALGEELDPHILRELEWRHGQESRAHYALAEGLDPKKLEESGWGVIFARGADPAVRDALSDLLERRKEQAGPLYKEFGGADAYRKDESKNDFLKRHRHGPGPVDPERVPYYLLIVGGPEDIPFRFQYLMDVQFAMGRISFDTAEEYRNYARSVLKSEKANARTGKRAVFLGVRNPGDQATQLSADSLVKPLAASVRKSNAAWNVDDYIGDTAHKEQLASLVNSGTPPQLLFSASHGMGFPSGHARQLRHQGAILCQDWPGPLKHRGEIAPDWYFSADDVGKDADLGGLVVFMFACFGAGTPKMDDFSHQAFREPQPIAPHDFVAALPRKLLANPAGGALAVVGHVERAWGYSFAWPGAGPQLQVFESTLKRLMSGHPIGSALEYFNSRYAELATMLATMIEDAQYDPTKTDELDLAGTWTALNDSRSYVILGDPAVTI
jgi:hypothetical protein